MLMSLYAKERPEYLRESLQSIFEQTLPPAEVVLVEDGVLTPELNEVLDEFGSRYKELKRIPLSENRGLGLALNAGLAHCTHNLVARMDSDDICFPHRFEMQMRYMLEHPEIDACSSWLREFEDHPENVKSVKKLPQHSHELYSYARTRCPLNHPAVMFRKDAVEQVGGYVHFRLFEDWHLWARMISNGCGMANIPDCLVHFRSSPEMIKRRGGWRYALHAINFQMELRELNFISSYTAVKNSLVRSAVCLMPNSVRSLFYLMFLRR